MPRISLAPYQLFALASMAFAGLTSVVARLGMSRISGEGALATRTAVVFVLVWGYVLAAGKTEGLASMSGRDYLMLALSGGCTFGSWLFYYKAIKLGPVSEVALIDKGSIVITLVLAALFLGEALTLTKLAALGLIVSGLLLLLRAG